MPKKINTDKKTFEKADAVFLSVILAVSAIVFLPLCLLNERSILWGEGVVLPFPFLFFPWFAWAFCTGLIIYAGYKTVLFFIQLIQKKKSKALVAVIITAVVIGYIITIYFLYLFMSNLQMSSGYYPEPFLAIMAIIFFAFLVFYVAVMTIVLVKRFKKSPANKGGDG
ncbi:MAG: hypothetical protein FWD58_04800 [Firmicutes bacterium]|nr:hypothetical protein [Bacillota bacterium]